MDSVSSKGCMKRRGRTVLSMRASFLTGGRDQMSLFVLMWCLLCYLGIVLLMPCCQAGPSKESTIVPAPSTGVGAGNMFKISID